MKKTSPKLFLRSQTLRTLTTIDLSRAMGGGDPVDPRGSAVVDSGDAACPTTIPAAQHRG